MSTALPSPQDQGQHQDPTLPPSLQTDPPPEFHSRASVDVTATADGTLAHSHAEGSASDGAGNGAGGFAQKGGEDEDEGKDGERQANNLPWSSPLTRSSTGESVHRERQGAERGDEQRASVAADPLPAETEEEHEHDFTPTVAEEHAPEGEEAPKPRATVTRQASRIDLDAKLELQPWDLVDPPETNNATTNGEYYASLKGQKYNTLNSPRARPLIPKSSYYFGPPPSDSAYGTPPVGQIGLHHPREILRVERDYSGGELIQFAPIYPLELDGRITPTQFLESINAINEVLISAHSLRYSFLDNMLAVFTLQLSRVFLTAHYEKEMRRLQELIHELNLRVYNPAGLNILWPRRVAFLFMEIEYYVRDPHFSESDILISDAVIFWPTYVLPVSYRHPWSHPRGHFASRVLFLKQGSVGLRIYIAFLFAFMGSIAL